MSRAAVISISAKCSDMCFSSLKDESGNIISEKEGYVPSFFPDEGGDYIALDIDLQTGKILNWKTPSPEDISAFQE